MLIERVAQAYGMTPDEIIGGSKRRAVVAARSVVSALAVRELGLPLVKVARAMSISSQTVLAGMEKGAEALQSQRLNAEALLAGLRNPKKPNNVPLASQLSG
jgi:chromosomal replication initiation ATPase DnaA